MSCQHRFQNFSTLLLQALRSPHYKCPRWIILTISMSMFVSCFKSSRAWPRVYPHHHLYFQILRNVTNYSEQITSSRSEIYEFQTRLCRVTKVDCSDEILPVSVSLREGYKTHSTGNKKLSQFSPMSSLLLPHCSPMKISAVVMNHCQWRPDLPDDVCLIIWPNAIGIQILPPPLLAASE